MWVVSQIWILYYLRFISVVLITFTFIRCPITPCVCHRTRIAPVYKNIARSGSDQSFTCLQISHVLTYWPPFVVGFESYKKLLFLWSRCMIPIIRYWTIVKLSEWRAFFTPFCSNSYELLRMRILSRSRTRWDFSIKHPIEIMRIPRDESC